MRSLGETEGQDRRPSEDDHLIREAITNIVSPRYRKWLRWRYRYMPPRKREQREDEEVGGPPSD